MKIKGKLVDIFNRQIYNAEITIENSKITEISKIDEEQEQYIIPGFIDSHIHIESSMLVPTRFAEISVPHGTVACVSDPHEIANVLGEAGIEFMIENSKDSPQKFFFGVPSCVPATDFETSGAVIDAEITDKLLQNDDIFFLAEMMNFPGVINEVPEVMSKLDLAKKYGKPIDGHAPLLSGDALKKYATAGITTDHECTNIKEAEEKIKLGMKILIRNGSAAKDFDNLFPLIDKYPDKVMFCSDDRHPDDLIEGHINILVKESIKRGAELFNVLQAACINPILHYNLPVGLLRKGDSADLIIVDNLQNFNIQKSIINGNIVFEKGEINFNIPKLEKKPNKFEKIKLLAEDIKIKAETQKIRVIKAFDKSLLTKQMIVDAKVKNGFLQIDTEKDILKIVVVNRYKKAKPSIAFINGIGLKKGALATSVAHDSHNIIAIGTSDEEIVNAINAVSENKGGMAISENNNISILPLPIAGLMSDSSGYEVAKKYEELNKKAKTLGTELNAPFMTMSFMALLVIPELKLGDKGLFDVTKFSFTNLFVE